MSPLRRPTRSTLALYRSMRIEWLQDLRQAFMLDAARPGALETTRAFCTARIALIDQVIAEKARRKAQRKAARA